MNSADLELVEDGSVTQTVGIRWPGLAIPHGAAITNAYIQFAAREAQSVATSLTFRAESINLFNTPQFAEPGTDLTSPNFGQITNTLNDGRSFQFTLQFQF